MKKIIFILSLIFTTNSFSQIDTNKVSLISDKRDTLYLPKTQLGYSISTLWPKDLQKKPIIIFKSEDWILKEYLRREKINK